MNHRGAKSPVPPEIALANDVFDQFCAAGSMKTILGHYRHLCDLLSVKPTNYPQFYPKLKLKLKSWKAQALWNKFDKRASHKCYNRGKACSNHRVLIIGAGPCGLRAAIEAQLLGAKVVVLEKRDRFSRNNVLHLWPFVIHDLKSLGAKKFFGKFCAGSIDHISIRQLQCILMKVALILGVEIHEGVGFESLLAPPSTQDAEKIGWRAVVSPPEHPVSQYEFNVLVGADGKRNTLEGFKRKEFRGKLAIAITANFINKKSEAEARVEEISGVAFIFNQKFFKDLYAETGIDLENIVYYKDDTHYFVMTAKKQSLLDKGVILQDYNDTARLLSQDNIDKEALKGYARQAANFSTDYQLPALEYAVNHYGQPDVAMFDFTSMYAAENASRYCERHGHRLLMTLVGDSLLEPFWPTGSGCARGFLSSMDACWAIRSWAQGNLNPLEVLAERESIYRILGQTTPENLHRDHAAYSLDPATRYPNLNPRSVLPGQVRGLYDTDEPATLEMYLRAPAAAAAASAQDTPKKRRRRDPLLSSSPPSPPTEPSTSSPQKLPPSPPSPPPPPRVTKHMSFRTLFSHKKKKTFPPNHPVAISFDHGRDAPPPNPSPPRALALSRRPKHSELRYLTVSPQLIPSLQLTSAQKRHLQSTTVQELRNRFQDAIAKRHAAERKRSIHLSRLQFRNNPCGTVDESIADLSGGCLTPKSSCIQNSRSQVPLGEVNSGSIPRAKRAVQKGKFNKKMVNHCSSKALNRGAKRMSNIMMRRGTHGNFVNRQNMPKSTFPNHSTQESNLSSASSLTMSNCQQSESFMRERQYSKRLSKSRFHHEQIQEQQARSPKLECRSSECSGGTRSENESFSDECSDCNSSTESLYSLLDIFYAVAANSNGNYTDANSGHFVNYIESRDVYADAPSVKYTNQHLMNAESPVQNIDEQDPSKSGTELNTVESDLNILRYQQSCDTIYPESDDTISHKGFSLESLSESSHQSSFTVRPSSIGESISNNNFDHCQTTDSLGHSTMNSNEHNMNQGHHPTDFHQKNINQGHHTIDQNQQSFPWGHHRSDHSVHQAQHCSDPDLGSLRGRLVRTSSVSQMAPSSLEKTSLKGLIKKFESLCSGGQDPAVALIRHRQVDVPLDKPAPSPLTKPPSPLVSPNTEQDNAIDIAKTNSVSRNRSSNRTIRQDQRERSRKLHPSLIPRRKVDPRSHQLQLSIVCHERVPSPSSHPRDCRAGLEIRASADREIFPFGQSYRPPILCRRSHKFMNLTLAMNSSTLLGDPAPSTQDNLTHRETLREVD